MDLGEKLVAIEDRIFAGFANEMEKSNIPPTLALIIADNLHGRVAREAYGQINRIREAEVLKGEADDSTEDHSESDT